LRLPDGVRLLPAVAARLEAGADASLLIAMVMIGVAGTLGSICACPARQRILEYDNPFDVGLTGLLRIFIWLPRHDECEVFDASEPDFPTEISIHGRDICANRTFRGSPWTSAAAGLRIHGTLRPRCEHCCPI